MKKDKIIKSKLVMCMSTILVGSIALNIACSIKLAKLDNEIKGYKQTITETKAYNDALRHILNVYKEEVNKPPKYFDVPLDEALQNHIWSLCCQYDIEEYYSLIFAIIDHESDFTTNVISKTNDYGLMQINVINHNKLSNDLGITNFLDPYQNVHAGIHIIASLLHKYDVATALMAYNMGEGGARKQLQNGVYSTAYTDSVLSIYNKIYKE